MKLIDISPYAYCGGDPVNLVDPDGNSTWVFQFAEGHYMVTDKGNPHDGDNNVYVGYFDSEGEWNETSEVLGQTLVGR